MKSTEREVDRTTEDSKRMDGTVVSRRRVQKGTLQKLGSHCMKRKGLGHCTRRTDGRMNTIFIDFKSFLGSLLCHRRSKISHLSGMAICSLCAASSLPSTLLNLYRPSSFYCLSRLSQEGPAMRSLSDGVDAAFVSCYYCPTRVPRG